MERIKNAICGLFSKLFSSQSRISYRRIMVFAVATALLFTTAIDADIWCYVALAYIAGDSAEKALAALGK